MSLSNTAALKWRINGVTIQREVPLHNGEVLLSAYYLQSLLPPHCKLSGLNAIVESETATTYIDVVPRFDHEGSKHYLLDGSLSKDYLLAHSNDCVYVSDSVETSSGDRISTSGTKTSPVCVDDDSGCSVEHILEPDDESDCSLKQYSIPKSGTLFNEDLQRGKGPLMVKETDVLNVESEDNESPMVERKSIVQWIQENIGAGRIKKLLSKCQDPLQVDELPPVYNGTMCFELPPTFGKKKQMDGMEQKYDGHLWTRPSTSNMSIQCIVRSSYCLGSLVCHRLTCSYYNNEKQSNDSCFHGHLDRQVSKGYPAAIGKSKITCHYCQKVVTCCAICTCMIYYVFPLDDNMTRLVIHVGDHLHNVQKGTQRATIEKVQNLVRTVLKVEKGGPRKVQMLVAREMLFESITKEDDSVATDKDLNHFLEEMMPLVQNKGFKGIVSQEKEKQGSLIGDGYDNILQLQRRCMFPFFHGSRFPGQGGPHEKCFLFKMSTKGPASGVDLVNRMRCSGMGDLRNAWVHFDHTHRIDGWATMSYSVYDPSMRSLQVIAICETKEEDCESQVLFWNNLNSVMEQCGQDPPDFAGFMSDEAGANWSAIRTVYNGGPQPMCWKGGSVLVYFIGSKAYTSIPEN